MRQIINISLPDKWAKLVNNVVGTGQYATKSEFFRDLLRDWSEKKLLQELKQSRKELKTTDGYLLKSLKDLR